MEAATSQPDIIILDLGLPDMEGVEIIKRIREWSKVPIIVVSARSENQDKPLKDSTVFLNGNLKIDYSAGCAWLSGEEIHLTPIEYKLLCLLTKHVGKVLTHIFILHEIWGNYSSDIPALRVFMATLRKKMKKQTLI